MGLDPSEFHELTPEDVVIGIPAINPPRTLILQTGPVFIVAHPVKGESSDSHPLGGITTCGLCRQAGLTLKS